MSSMKGETIIGRKQGRVDYHYIHLVIQKFFNCAVHTYIQIQICQYRLRYTNIQGAAN